MANAVQLATIVIDAGSDWALTLGWEDEDGQPIPYTAIESEIRTVNDSLLARMTLDSGVVVDGETFRLEIDDETTKDFPAGTHKWDLWVEGASARRVRLAFADVLVRRSVTAHG